MEVGQTLFTSTLPLLGTIFCTIGYLFLRQVPSSTYFGNTCEQQCHRRRRAQKRDRDDMRRQLPTENTAFYVALRTRRIFFSVKQKHQGIFIKENGHKKWKEVHWKWCDYFPLRLYWVKGCREKKIHVSGIARIFIRLVTKGGTSCYDVLQYPPLLLNSNWMRRT